MLMMGEARRRTACDNLNHRRSQAPVRHCPRCGVVVNERIGLRQCNDAKHAAARREQSTYCIDCGLQLISLR
jgi:hypothetical protein